MELTHYSPISFYIKNQERGEKIIQCVHNIYLYQLCLTILRMWISVVLQTHTKFCGYSQFEKPTKSFCPPVLWQLGAFLILDDKQASLHNGEWLCRNSMNRYKCHNEGDVYMVSQKVDAAQFEVHTAHSAQQCWWTLTSSGTWCCVTRQVVPHILKDCSAVIFTVRQSNRTISPWGWSHYEPFKCQQLLLRQITSQKMWIFK
jgi:hypothetical protein